MVALVICLGYILLVVACSIKDILKKQWEQSLLSIGIVTYLMATRHTCFIWHFDLKTKHFAFVLCKLNSLDSHIWEGNKAFDCKVFKMDNEL